ncbi:hypothetical protein [Bosea sp. (in: a-proteobacteria)]|uniref:hypothetical protein n=1 Tax=Bosea sp. (in: a-proteobacteria) TaxID=1871050 RepID=UPI002B47B5EF|nr:hypothetical protein [Bosea sp. (in: a-proteobacteria)]WRH60122.1 MAG: hypothetical protein RSE11_10260 [Bosea sp. (in: a-proteobacteria)]
MTKFSQWLPSFSLLAVSTAVLPLLSQNLSDPRIGAGVFPPWWSSHDIIAAAAAAGSIVRLGTFPFIVVVRSDGHDVADNLRASGSLFNLDPVGIAGCFTR